MIETLSNDAKAIAGSLFGLMSGKSIVNFGLRETRPAPRTQVALDELVKAGVIAKSALPGGGVSYKPVQDTKPYARWLGAHIADDSIEFKIVEAIPKGERT